MQKHYYRYFQIIWEKKEQWVWCEHSAIIQVFHVPILTLWLLWVRKKVKGGYSLTITHDNFLAGFLAPVLATSSSAGLGFSAPEDAAMVSLSCKVSLLSIWLLIPVKQEAAKGVMLLLVGWLILLPRGVGFLWQNGVKEGCVRNSVLPCPWGSASGNLQQVLLRIQPLQIWRFGLKSGEVSSKQRKQKMKITHSELCNDMYKHTGLEMRR